MAKKIGMSTHSTNSFTESNGNRILSALLESTNKVKTFFGENEKTPNHDGFFELLVDDETSSNKPPKKQFIVQTKTVSNLNQLSNGNYSYNNLKTNFLYYVKSKVAESPAIYFIIDLSTKNIFWIYLSDEKLMSMNFEEREEITYHFNSGDTISNVDDFISALHNIADERNKKFLYKSSEELAEMQDAIEYLNNIFNNDLKFIKDSMFPNLWRFGVGVSDIGNTSMLLATGS